MMKAAPSKSAVAFATYLAAASAALLLSWFLTASEALARDYATPGTFAVEVRDEVWRDTSRDREVPVKLRIPQGLTAPAPVIVFSHGLGGSREGGRLWGEHWASHGYWVVHVQHPGSDESVWKSAEGTGRMRALMRAMTPENLRLRVADSQFVASELERRAGSGSFKFADIGRLGMSGHSFGAQTTLALAGQVFPKARRERQMIDPRFKSSIAFSPNARDSASDLDEQFGAIKQPVLFLTGSQDGAVTPGDKTRPEDRKLPYQHSPGPGKFLAYFDGGDHMVFGGHQLRRAPTPRDGEIQADVKALSLAFWDGYLRGDDKARAWFATSARGMLAAGDEFASK